MDSNHPASEPGPQGKHNFDGAAGMDVTPRALVSTPRNLRLGLVGNGNRGIIAQQAATADGHAQIAAVADPHPSAQARVATRFGEEVAIGAGIDVLLNADLDAAFVTSLDYQHAEHAVKLLRAGIAVFVDKPLATTLDDADNVLRAAYESGSRLYVGHNMRHMPVIMLMRDIIEAGRIGQVKAIWCRYFVGDGGDRFFKDWHAERGNVNSLLLQKGAHDIDVIHWLAGGYSRRVSAMGALTVYGDITSRQDRSGQMVSEWLDRDRNWPPLSQTGMNPVIDVEDLSMMTMALDNGVFATYSECHYTPDYWRNYTVIGTEGRIENFGLGRDGVVRLWNRRTEYNADGDEQFPIPAVEGNHRGADPALLREFLEFVRTGAPTMTSPIAAREAVAAGEAATHSMRTDSSARDIPPLASDLREYFEGGQISRN